MWPPGKTAAAVCALVGAGWATAVSQSPRVGFVDAVTGLASSDTCATWRPGVASRDSIAIVRQGRESPVWPRDSAILLDRLRVGRYSDVRFHVDQARFGAGTFFFTPDLGRCAGIRGIQSTTGRGSYRISSRKDVVRGRPVDRLVLSIDNGAAIVEWSSGPLSVIALGREILDTGTVFAVIVDSAAGRAFLYVHEGLVGVAGAPAVRATAGRAFAFGRTGQFDPVTPSSQLVGDVTYQSRVVWTQPPNVPVHGGFPWRTVGVVGGSAALVGGYVVWQNNHHPAPKQPLGAIRVHIPL